MFAVIRLGNQQYKVAEGEIVQAHRLDYEIGQKVTLEPLLVSDGTVVKVGQPLVQGAQVQAEVVAHPRGTKVIAFKYRKRKDSARTHGHRQDLTSLKIEKISL